MYNPDFVEITDSPRDETGDTGSLHLEQGRALGSPSFRKPQRAPYEAPEGWRTWQEFTRYSEDLPT